jgi:hypothetical protein
MSGAEGVAPGGERLVGPLRVGSDAGESAIVESWRLATSSGSVHEAEEVA